ncbi:MAG: hypothetical protein CBB71_20895 [Rhodopirellula sp. TMED11]|nr:MAG: hypothetical protein CBB71_20895 [Rhodopirellula sp. TMED11]
MNSTHLACPGELLTIGHQTEPRTAGQRITGTRKNANESVDQRPPRSHWPHQAAHCQKKSSATKRDAHQSVDGSV